MAQATNAVTMRVAKLEISTNGTVWSDISGFSNAVSWDGAERQTENTKTFDGDLSLIGSGKRDPVNVTARVLYTEGASEPYKVADDAYRNNTPLYMRWTPRGTGSGYKVFTTTAGTVKKPAWPQGEAESAKHILVEIQIECADVTESTSA